MNVAKKGQYTLTLRDQEGQVTKHCWPGPDPVSPEGAAAHPFRPEAIVFIVPGEMKMVAIPWHAVTRAELSFEPDRILQPVG